MTDETKGDGMTRAEIEVLWSNIWQWEESHSSDLEDDLIALRDYIDAHLAAQSAMRVDEAMPSYWCAVGDTDVDGSGGEIVLAYPANDGNNGEAARAECNQYINDAMLNDGVKLHLVPLYTRAALQAAIGGKE